MKKQGEGSFDGRLVDIMEDGKRIFRMILNILIPAGAIVLVCTLGPWLLKFFMPFVIGWCIALICNPLVKFLEKRLKLVRKHSSAVIVVVVLTVVIWLIYFLISRIILGSMAFSRELPQLYEVWKEELQETFDGFSVILDRMPTAVQEAVNRINTNLGTLTGSLVEKLASPTVAVAGNVAKGIPVALVYSVVVILSSYFFIVERDKIMAWGKKHLPQGLQNYSEFLKKDIKTLIGGYFLAQFKIMFVVAVILAVGLVVLRVKHGILVAVLIAFLDFLPVFGTGTVLFPWAVIKLFSGQWTFAVGLVVIYVLTQAVRQVLQPKIMGDSIGMPPLLSLIFLYLGFKIKGISGMILAVPIGMFVLNLYHYGVFDSMIQNTKFLAEEIHRFRKEE